ncbi:LRR receptor-like serine/threonine-protein kinase GHR1 [Octopus sinensis]|uniref:LRR receptor-like serine/threonine-protein kinase GHR1 n=1 Tax=Octopus sinensis TaxID=2607531 RepID=A0A7E6EGY6_9MOLL|nr:LRR receptor-like serine/threonine-protein kinase GHR1 [Octopus sinensis]
MLFISSNGLVSLLFFVRNEFGRMLGDERNRREAFDRLTKLEHLSLRSNVIEKLEVDTFKRTVNLRMIDLSWNLLTSLDFDLRNQTNLAEIDLSNNELTVIEENNLLGTENLKKINLDGNSITNIHRRAFIHSSAISQLILSNNLMEQLSIQLPSSSHNFYQLYVDLKNCRLNTFPVLETSTLSILNLTNNKIKSISVSDVSKLGNSLLSIDVRRNRLEWIEDGVFAYFPELVNFNADHNFLTRIPARLSRSLLQLSLRNNSISGIESNCFLGLSQLKELYLAHNQISHLPALSFTGLKSILTLDISHNHISVIDLSSLTALSSLRTIFITQNSVPNVTVVSPKTTERPGNDEIFYGTSKDPLVKTLERPSNKSAMDLEQFDAWIDFEPKRLKCDVASLTDGYLKVNQGMCTDQSVNHFDKVICSSHTKLYSSQEYDKMIHSLNEEKEAIQQYYELYLDVSAIDFKYASLKVLSPTTNLTSRQDCKLEDIVALINSYYGYDILKDRNIRQTLESSDLLKINFESEKETDYFSAVTSSTDCIKSNRILWSIKEEATLLDAVKVYGKDFDYISTILHENQRSASAIKRKWEKMSCDKKLFKKVTKYWRIHFKK